MKPRSRNTFSRTVFPCAITLSLLAAIPAADAATATWDGATNTNWNADNWAGGAGADGRPGSGDNLYFQGNTNTSTNNDFTAGTVFGEIRFNNNGSLGKTAGFTLDGNDIGTNFGFRLSGSSTAITDTVELNINNAAGGPNKTWFLGADRTLVLNGVLSGSINTLTFRDGGTVEFNNVNNSFAQVGSGLIMENGTLIVGANAPSGANGALGNSTKDVNVGGGLRTVAGATATLLISGSHIVGRNITAGTVADTDAFTSTVGGSNTSGTATYTGNMTLGDAATTPNMTFNLQAAAGGTVEFITGTWTTNDRTINVGMAGNTGTVKLSNDITTTGGIDVNFGTLSLGATATADVTVASGATLGGSGTIVGNLTVNGTHGVGSGPETQTVEGNLTYNSGSIFEWDLDTTTSGRGTAYDGVNVEGTGVLGGSGAAFAIILEGSQNFSDAFWTTSQSWTDIFIDEGSTDLAYQSIFSSFTYANTNGSLDPSAHGSFAISGSTLSWTAVPIPEPSSALAGLLLSAGLLRRRKH